MIIGDVMKVLQVEKRDKNTIRFSIYKIYTSDDQKLNRKKENWKRYCTYCRENRLSNSVENQRKFKKTRVFVKEFSKGSFFGLMGHYDMNTLDYILSVAKDMEKRGENFSSYISSNLLGTFKVE